MKIILIRTKKIIQKKGVKENEKNDEKRYYLYGNYY